MVYAALKGNMGGVLHALHDDAGEIVPISIGLRPAMVSGGGLILLPFTSLNPG